MKKFRVQETTQVVETYAYDGGMYYNAHVNHTFEHGTMTEQEITNIFGQWPVPAGCRHWSHLDPGESTTYNRGNGGAWKFHRIA